MRNQTLTSLALACPEAAGIFQAHGLDYCCRGDVMLDEACARRGIDPAIVVAEIESASAARALEADVDALALDVATLVDFLREQHDMYLRAAIPFVAPLAARVAKEHRARDPRLDEVRDLTVALRRLLERHLDEEEDELFPAIRDGRAPDGDDVRAAEHEHREIGAALERLRRLTDGYRAPSWACPCYRTLLDWLHTLETNLMRQVHLENHVLLPRSTCSMVERTG